MLCRQITAGKTKGFHIIEERRNTTYRQAKRAVGTFSYKYKRE